MKQKKSTKRSPLKVLTTIVAIVVVILFVAAGIQINDHSRGYVYEYDARDYIYSAENGRFEDLYQTTMRDMGKNGTYSTEVAECRALAFYYEQAVLEHAYREAGDDAKADEFAQRMKEYEAQLGSLASKTELVHKQITAREG